MAFKFRTTPMPNGAEAALRRDLPNIQWSLSGTDYYSLYQAHADAVVAYLSAYNEANELATRDDKAVQTGFSNDDRWRIWMKYQADREGGGRTPSDIHNDLVAIRQAMP